MLVPRQDSQGQGGCSEPVSTISMIPEGKGKGLSRLSVLPCSPQLCACKPGLNNGAGARGHDAHGARNPDNGAGAGPGGSGYDSEEGVPM